MRSLSFLFTICNREDKERIDTFLERAGVKNGLAFLGKGTATREILSLLGIGETDKAITLSAMSAVKARDVACLFNAAIWMDLKGAIAFTLPVSSIGGASILDQVLSVTLAELDEETDMDDTAMNEVENITYELIVAITTQGFTGAVMDAARAAGARGGTSFHAGGTHNAKLDNFMHVTLQKEKDVLFILVPCALRRAVMQSIVKEAGSGTDANTVVFSLPVTDTAGLSGHSGQSGHI
ncbi:nitrogen regulatory protein P-II [Clostridia bacterium]|nr:nitrogen regulatory protein P-II [Clostridia bacterium]